MRLKIEENPPFAMMAQCNEICIQPQLVQLFAAICESIVWRATNTLSGVKIHVKQKDTSFESRSNS